METTTMTYLKYESINEEGFRQMSGPERQRFLAKVGRRTHELRAEEFKRLLVVVSKLFQHQLKKTRVSTTGLFTRAAQLGGCFGSTTPKY